MAKKKLQPEQIAVLNRITSKSVLKCTGKNWDEWIQILDSAGAQNLTHKEIVAFLVKKYKSNLWWQQLITTSYEVHIGRRQQGRNLKGEYSTVATKTLAIEQKKLWKLMLSSEGQKLWLKPLSPVRFHLKEQFEVEGGFFGEIRTLKAPQRLRFTLQDSEWEKSSVVQLLCHARPKGKTMLGFQHEKIKDLRLKKQMLEHWKQVLQDIEESLFPKK